MEDDTSDEKYNTARDRVRGCNSKLYVSRPDSWSDPIGESEPSSGCENIYWDSLPA